MEYHFGKEGTGMRAFFCVPLPASIRGQIEGVAASLQRGLRMSASWVRPGNYHLTLRFLGEIDPMLSIPLDSAARRVARAVAPFELAITQVGLFPDARRPRVIWVGCASESFERLASTMGDTIEELGFPLDRRPASPHVTLARIKGRPDPELEHMLSVTNPLPGWRVPVDRIVLMESKLTSRGAVYAPLFTTHLEGRPSESGDGR